MNPLRKLPVISVALIVASVAQADLITYEFSGAISRVSNYSGAALDTFGIGDHFKGVFAYNPDAVYVRDIEANRYLYSGASAPYNAKVGTAEFDASGGSQIQLFDDYDYGYDQFFLPSTRIYDLPSELIGTASFALIRVQLRDSTGSIFSDGALPDSLNLNDFAWRHFGVTGYASPSEILWHMRGNIESLHSVSEPGTLALLSVGLAGMGLAIRRKKI